MGSYFRILYVNTRSPGKVGELPYDIKIIRDWTWNQCAVVRWSTSEPSDVSGSLNDVGLIILDWSSRNVGAGVDDAANICEVIRREQPTLPILIVSDGVAMPDREAFVEGASHAHVISVDQITNLDPIENAIRDLGVALPGPSISLPRDSDDVTVNSLIEWVGHDRLRLMIQKFFPGSSATAFIRPVSGGWSDAKLCRLYFDNDRNLYFMKFFTRADEHRSELSRHEAAKSWLKDSVVDLKLIPELAANMVAQTEAFPDTGPPIYPVCYESASTLDNPRETYKQLYRDCSDGKAEDVLKRLLQILASDQTPQIITEPAWSVGSGIAFSRTRDLVQSVLTTIDDLSLYGTPMCYGDADKWEEYYRLLQGIVYQPFPPWLADPLPVMVGHVHGDPNPRNCLVSRTDVTDIRLIDCGGYVSNGRLVSDLALIERDVKLVLMNTEKSAGGFFDLDITHLVNNWCHAEREAISRGLNYGLEHVPVSPGSVNRAYRLVSHIRKRAKEVTAPTDSDGRHYFAALLFWTLDVLKYRAVRSTKRLLGLYSSAEIIRKFK